MSEIMGGRGMFIRLHPLYSPLPSSTLNQRLVFDTLIASVALVVRGVVT